MARAREAFAGVRSATPPGDDPHSDLTCCAYGRSCTILRDDALAALVESDQHLQTWTADKEITVDRYDVRLLLHDTRQLGNAGKHTTGAPGTEDNEELDFERFRDLHPAQAAVAAPEAESQPDADFAPGMAAYMTAYCERPAALLSHKLKLFCSQVHVTQQQPLTVNLNITLQLRLIMGVQKLSPL